jgi:WYL_2, Sm-like SH3 beta-barrel fold
MSNDEILNLRELLKSNVVEVVFTKVNGDKRTLNCTLLESFLPVSQETVVERKKSNDSLAVWSTEDNGWRSFRFDSVISFGIKE